VSLGELRDAVASLTGYSHDVSPFTHSSLPQNGTVNGVNSDGLSLVFVAYATRVSVFAPPTLDQVVLVIPLGPMWVEVCGSRTVMTTPFMLSASEDSIMYPDPLAGALVGSTTLERLTADLRQIFGDDREFTINLSQPRPIQVGSSASLRRAWLAFAANPQWDKTTGLIDDMLVSLAPYTNYRMDEQLGWLTPPSYLVHAVRYLRHNLSEPISILEVAQLCDIGARQLQLAFKTHFGCSAQDYLKRIRLERARELLSLRGGPQRKTVAQVSLEVGIPHHGRFAEYFSDHFGMVPSAVTEGTARK
jgi:AraC-like DNA-binding protein